MLDKADRFIDEERGKAKAEQKKEVPQKETQGRINVIYKVIQLVFHPLKLKVQKKGEGN